MNARHKYHVFLSHNSADKPAVRKIAQALNGQNFRTWLDEWNLAAGDQWQPELEQALLDSKCCAVFVGPTGLGPWQHQEMRLAIQRQVESRTTDEPFRVIPVLLPGATRGDRAKLPPFLTGNVWVEFAHDRDVKEDSSALEKLANGLKGLPIGPGAAAVPEQIDCPYRGLEFFDVQHAGLYFGRDDLVDWLLAALRGTQSKDGPTRFLAILGASGSGKSSLARAGLLFALGQGELPGSAAWPQAICRPGARPLESLVTSLASVKHFSLGDGPHAEVLTQSIESLRRGPDRLHLTVAGGLKDLPSAQRMVLLVDQFEELFTSSGLGGEQPGSSAQACDPSHTERDRQAFIENLLYAATVEDGRLLVVLTMRADFCGKCARYPSLADAIASHQFLVGPMTDAQLREAIVRPAGLVKCRFDPGLVGLLVREVRDEPGALPLLQFALRELWKRQDVDRFTVAAYRQIGELRGALERHASSVLKRWRGKPEFELCRRVFLRLVQPGEGTEHTKRRVAWREILPDAEVENRVEAVIQTLADERLITTEGEFPSQNAFIEIAHEALIHGWKQLGDWIDADLAGLRTHRRLTEAAQEWARTHEDPAERDTGLLYRDTRLAVARGWSEQHPGDLNELEREFLDVSQRREKEEHEQKLTAARRLRRRNRLVVVASATVGVAIVLVVFFFLRARSQQTQADRAAARGILMALTDKAAEIGDTAGTLRLQQVEHDALWELAAEENEQIRRHFLEQALESDDLAARFLARYELASQAVLGLSEDRRLVLREMLIKKLQEPGLTVGVLTLCARLGEEYGDASLSVAVIEAILEHRIVAANERVSQVDSHEIRIGDKLAFSVHLELQELDVQATTALTQHVLDLMKSKRVARLDQLGRQELAADAVGIASRLRELGGDERLIQQVEQESRNAEGPATAATGLGSYLAYLEQELFPLDGERYRHDDRSKAVRHFIEKAERFEHSDALRRGFVSVYALLEDLQFPPRHDFPTAFEAHPAAVPLSDCLEGASQYDAAELLYLLLATSADRLTEVVDVSDETMGDRRFMPYEIRWWPIDLTNWLELTRTLIEDVEPGVAALARDKLVADLQQPECLTHRFLVIKYLHQLDRRCMKSLPEDAWRHLMGDVDSHEAVSRSPPTLADVIVALDCWCVLQSHLPEPRPSVQAGDFVRILHIDALPDQTQKAVATAVWNSHLTLTPEQATSAYLALSDALDGNVATHLKLRGLDQEPLTSSYEDEPHSANVALLTTNCAQQWVFMEALPVVAKRLSRQHIRLALEVAFLRAVSDSDVGRFPMWTRMLAGMTESLNASDAEKVAQFLQRRLRGPSSRMQPPRSAYQHSASYWEYMRRLPTGIQSVEVMQNSVPNYAGEVGLLHTSEMLRQLRNKLKPETLAALADEAGVFMIKDFGEFPLNELRGRAVVFAVGAEYLPKERAETFASPFLRAASASTSNSEQISYLGAFNAIAPQLSDEALVEYLKWPTSVEMSRYVILRELERRYDRPDEFSDVWPLVGWLKREKPEIYETLAAPVVPPAVSALRPSAQDRQVDPETYQPMFPVEVPPGLDPERTDPAPSPPPPVPDDSNPR